MKTLSLIILFFISLTAFSNKTANENNTSSEINGKVIDRLTGENLAGVKIEIPSENITVYSDFDGNFSISIPKQCEKSEINISYISYETTKLEVSELNNASEIKILPITL